MQTVPFVGFRGDRVSAQRMIRASSPRRTAGFVRRRRFVDMRRCLIALAIACVMPSAASADALTHGLTQLQRDVANDCRYAGFCSDDLSAYEHSHTHRTLAFQYELGSALALRDAPWIGTHNSFNSATEMGPTLSDSDPNQQLSLVDQLRIDVRALELDVHWFTNRPVVCHADGDFTGCSIEQTLDVELAKINGWLAQHPDQVILLYLEDHLGTQTGHDAGAKMIADTIGPRVYRPAGAGCQELPLTLTRDAVRAAGKQVIIVGGCGVGAAYQGLAYSWDKHVETRPIGFQGPPGCGPDFPRSTWDSTLVRYYEDSTFLTDGGSYVGQSTRDDGLTPAATTALVRCGVDLLGFDQLLPGDGRLDAAVWSWAPGEPRYNRGRCVVQRPSDGRWEVRRCAAKYGTAQPVPRTGYENEQLREAAGGKPVLLDLTVPQRSPRARHRGAAGSRSR
jgi:hypothetical protein